MIAKGCTVKNTFSIPFAEDEIEKIYITYCQKGENVIEKEKSDCTFETIVVPEYPALGEAALRTR